MCYDSYKKPIEGGEEGEEEGEEGEKCT